MSWFLKFKGISSGVFQKRHLHNGHYAPPAQRATMPHRLLSHQDNILNTIKTAKKSHAQWSFLASVQCSANRIFLVTSLRPSKLTPHCPSLIKHSNTRRASIGGSAVYRPNSTNPTELSPNSKQVFGNPLRDRVVPKSLSYFQGWSLQDWLKPHCEDGETCQSN